VDWIQLAQDTVQ